MFVCKFGGTSVQDADAQRRLARIVRDRLAEEPVVVVSALSGVSDGLLGLLTDALAGRDEASRDTLAAIGARHRDLLGAMGAPEHVRRESEAAIEAVLEEIESLRRGIVLLGDAGPHVRARLVGMGELLSSRIVAAALAAEGVPASWLDAREVVRTAGLDPEKDLPIPGMIAQACLERVKPVVAPGRAVVTQGFIGRDGAGRPTLLGRGGSDYSASLLGAALGATRIEIWTDVDGVLTANPRLVPEARRIRVLSFDEASELAYFGAKVLHPSTLLPAVERSIPVLVLNARRPDGGGTTIVGRGAPPADGRWVVKAIADKRGIALVNVVSTRMLMAHGFLARIFGVFDAHRTPVDLLATSEVSVSLTVDDTRRIDEIVRELSAFARVDVETGLAVLCLVGEGMRGRAEIAAEVFRAIRNVRVRLITQGASAINLGLVVPEADADGAVRALHETFFRGTLPAEVFAESAREVDERERARSALTRAVPGPVAGPSLESIARRHGTPVYVYDLDAVDARVAAVRQGLPDGPSRLLYACKANAHPRILERLAALGVGIEAASPGEVDRALSCGHAAASVLMSASNARTAELASTIEKGCFVALGSRSDIRRVGSAVRRAEVLLRVNPGVGDGHHAHVVTGGSHSKFGILLDDLPTAVEEAGRHGLEVIGLQAHIGSGIADPSPLLLAAERLLETATCVPDLRVLDLGGGFAVPYRDGDPAFGWTRWREGLAAVVDRFTAGRRSRPELWVEPGRFLVAPCGWLVAEVTCRKESGGLTFIGVDTGMNHFLRPALYGAYHRIVNLSAPDAPEEWVEVVGNVCETTDVFASNRSLPRAEEGHLLAIADAGAYGFSMASPYNLWPVPREVAVSGGQEIP